MSNVIKEHEVMAGKLKAIGHPMRVALFHLLCNCETEGLSVKSLYQSLGIDQPTTSRHLAVMRNSGLISRRVTGGQTSYCLCFNDPFVKCLSGCFITNNKIE
ncbi:MAG TPA: transcriptional regulator [Cryomorphaceae bacterium]|jgi:DNA-binding transcriptional ArsR family regulator|nr:transcriptional regulator [Owenweeksia sp.]HAD96389.1 transcriptional regulator [Cryomorphaceae bacterium]HBF20449.1 transcriptional regulator [Cryomorphaceae bacterium]